MGNLIRVLGYLRAYWWAVTVAMSCVVGVTYLNVIVPLIVRDIIDKVLIQGMNDQLSWLTLSIVLVAAAKGLVSFTQRYTQQYIGQKVVYSLRNDLFASLQQKSFSFYDKSQTGELMSKATNDVDQIRQLLGQWLEMLAASALTTITVMAVVASLDIRLAMVFMITMPFIFVITFYFQRQIRPGFSKVRQIYGEMASVLQQTIVGMKVVRAFAREGFEQDKFDEPHSRYVRTNVEIWRYRSIMVPSMAFCLAVGTALVYWFGGGEVIRGSLTVGELVASASYLMMLVTPVRFIGRLITFYTNAMASAERVFEVMDTRPDVREKNDARELPEFHKEIVFKNVSFEYMHGKRVLDDINLTVQFGETIALLGATGSGKSSLIQLIPRFYDVSQGSITIDGHDIRDVTLNSLRRQIAIVLQETFLFSGTIRDNVSFGRPNSTMNDIEGAARTAGAHEFITSLPDGYDTEVGERGVALSGGQKQRIAIARALLLNPRVLIFDDSTSSVDVETEHQIQESLEKLLQNRTTFIITQRVSTIKNADRIAVFENGKMIELGTHEQLLVQNGIYSKIYNTQFKEQQEILQISSNSR